MKEIGQYYLRARMYAPALMGALPGCVVKGIETQSWALEIHFSPWLLVLFANLLNITKPGVEQV